MGRQRKQLKRFQKYNSIQTLLSPISLRSVEEGPVYGPTLPLEAENPNVVMGGIYSNPRI